MVVGAIATGESARPFALALKGASVTPLAPVGLAGGRFSGVSCTDVGSCVAVGAVTGTTGQSFGERLAGAWRLLPRSSLRSA